MENTSDIWYGVLALIVAGGMGVALFLRPRKTRKHQMWMEEIELEEPPPTVEKQETAPPPESQYSERRTLRAARPSGFDPEATEVGVPALQLGELLLLDGREAEARTADAQVLRAVIQEQGSLADPLHLQARAPSPTPRPRTLWDDLADHQTRLSALEWWCLTVRWYNADGDAEVLLPLGPGQEALADYKARSKRMFLHPQKKWEVPAFELIGAVPIEVDAAGQATDPTHQKVARDQAQGRQFKLVRPLLPSFPDEMLKALYPPP